MKRKNRRPLKKTFDYEDTLLRRKAENKERITNLRKKKLKKARVVEIREEKREEERKKKEVLKKCLKTAYLTDKLTIELPNEETKEELLKNFIEVLKEEDELPNTQDERIDILCQAAFRTKKTALHVHDICMLWEETLGTIFFNYIFYEAEPSFFLKLKLKET